MLLKPSVRFEGRKLVCEFDPPVGLGEAMGKIFTVGMYHLRAAVRKHQAILWPES